jgi:UTP--glucose-1-phosphate uridylyltransferase
MTQFIPKEMLPIVDRPAIHYIVKEAISSGIDKILIVSRNDKKMLQDYFDTMSNVEFVFQEEPKGLGHAILCAESFVGNDPFAVLLPDDIIYSQTPCLKQMMSVYNNNKKSVLAVQKVCSHEIDKYGVINDCDSDNRTYPITTIVEKPPIEEAHSNIAVMGRYILPATIFDILKVANPGSNGEIQLTDALKEFIKIDTIFAYVFKGERYDVGSKIGYLKATVDFATHHPEVQDEFKKFLQTSSP